jgi:D-serine dehydratase
VTKGELLHSMLGKEEVVSWQDPKLHQLVTRLVELSIYLVTQEVLASEKRDKLFHSFIENMYPRGMTEVGPSKFVSRFKEP